MLHDCNKSKLYYEKNTTAFYVTLPIVSNYRTRSALQTVCRSSWTLETIRTLVNALLSSRLDYRNGLLLGLEPGIKFNVTSVLRQPSSTLYLRHGLAQHPTWLM